MVFAQPAGGASFSTLVPYTGWLLALALLIWIAKQFFGKFFQELASRFSVQFFRFFGSRFFGRRALAGYRRAILRNYGEHALGFRKGGTVNVAQVYVPLQYFREGHRGDVAAAVLSANRVVVVGEPGAGKSLLMKHLLIAWASRHSQEGMVPALVELHRCNATDRSLTDLIFAEFERNGVRGRQSLVERALEAGQLIVLFDGLDEVARDSQARVVRMIKDFVRTWDRCQYVTTCRTAVYTGQLSPEFPNTIQIADFDDAGIQQLLARWPGLKATEADQFFAGLTNSPQLMRLAGSPLLLTMMVFLYTEVFAKTGRTLPGSRPAFYEIAVEHLLRRDRDLARDDVLSIFEGADKRATLQRIALKLQETPPEHPDRRSIDRLQLIGTVKELAPDLNLSENQVNPLITEIVDRSQLLVQLDGASSRYAFRHLTLQEFLAAAELRGDPARILNAYRTDRDGWRETVRLWCGVTSLDCGNVVAQIYAGDAQDRVLALQCVAEATRIREDLASTIIEDFIDVLASGPPDTTVEAALGAVASDGRPRGQAVRNRLRDLLGSQSPGRAAAARALALTRLPSAAQVLGVRIRRDSDARAALRSMGEQAIPVLSEYADNGDLQSVDDLGEIATASAAAALGRLVWREEEVAYRAAWWLGSLIQRPEVESGLGASLQQSSLAIELRDCPIVSWAWQPFTDNPQLLAVLGRVVALLSAPGSADTVPAQLEVIDQRIGLAVTMRQDIEGPGTRSVFIRNDIRSGLRRPSGSPTISHKLIRAIFPVASVGLRYRMRSPDDEDLATMATVGDFSRLSAELAEVGLHTRNLQTAFALMSRPYREAAVLHGLVSHNKVAVNVQQWTRATTRTKVSTVLSIAYFAPIAAIAFAIVLSAGYRTFDLFFGAPPAGAPWQNVTVAIAFAMFVLTIALTYLAEEVAVGDFPGSSVLVPACEKVEYFAWRSPFDQLTRLVLTGLCIVFIVNAWSMFSAWTGLQVALIATSIVFACLALVNLDIRRRGQSASNPIRQTLDAGAMEAGWGDSVKIGYDSEYPGSR